MVLACILMSVAVLLVLFHTFMVKWPSIRVYYFTRKIQGLSGLPIIGNLQMLLTTKPEDVLDVIKNYMAVFPRLTSFYVSGVKYILFQQPQDVQALLGNADHIQKGVEYAVLQPWLNQGLLTSTERKWEARRKLLTPIYNHHIVDNSLDTINKKTDQLLEDLKSTNGKSTNVDTYISKSALEIIGETAIGTGLKTRETDEKTYQDCVKRTTEAAIERLLNVWQYKDWIFKLSQNGINFFRNLKVLHHLTEKEVKEKIESYDDDDVFELEDDEKQVKKSFLECYLEAQRTHPGLYCETNLDIREELDTFLFKGHETTSAAISFALWLLGTYPDEQDKVYSELKEIFGDGDREMTVQDAAKMNHLEKVIKETLRLYPSVPYISRLLNQDCILNDGTVVPDGVNAVVIPYFLHRDERFFPNPEKFDPERFSQENAAKIHPFSYIPFSAGPRNCIGQKLAMLQMKVTLAKILRKFKVRSQTRREEFKILPYLIIKPTVPLKCLFIPRT